MLIRGGALRFAGYLGMLALSVVMAAVLTRYLGVRRFGQYTTVMSLVAVVAAVTDAGMSSIGTREYAVLRGAEREAMIRDLLGLRVTLTLIGVALATAFAVAAGYDDALVLGTVTASLATVALVFQHTLSIPLTTDLRLGVLSALELLRQALWVGGVVLLAGVSASVFALLSVPLAVNVVLIVPTALLVRGRISARIVLDPATWPPLLRATVVFSLATAVGTIYIYAAQILTSIVTSGHQSGLFAVRSASSPFPQPSPGCLSVRRSHSSHGRPATTANGSPTSYNGFSRSACSVESGPQCVERWCGLRRLGHRRASTPPPRRCSPSKPALIGSFLAAGSSCGLLALRLHRGLLLSNAAALLASVVLTLVLAGADGARGAAIATICGEATLAATALLALIWKRPGNRPQLFVVVKVAVAGICAALLSLGPPMPSIVRPIVAVAVYSAAALLTKAIPSELKELIPSQRLRH